MASLPTASDGRGQRPNPLAPVAYTPQHPYHAPLNRGTGTISHATANGYPTQPAHLPFQGVPSLAAGPQYQHNMVGGMAHHQQQQQQQQQQSYLIHQSPQQQHQYQQPSSAVSAQGLARGSTTRSSDSAHLGQHSIAHDAAKLEYNATPNISMLSIASPTQQHQQQPLQVSATSNGYHQQFQQQQQQPHPTLQQAPYSPPFVPADQPLASRPSVSGSHTSYTSTATDFSNSLFRTPTASTYSTNTTAWSQPSSPGFPPSPFSIPSKVGDSDGPNYTGQGQQNYGQGMNGGLGGPGGQESQLNTLIDNVNVQQAQGGHSLEQIPEEARLLLDFNPGILSTIAVAFRDKMLQNEAKRIESANYGLEFPVTFTGKEAIDTIIEIVGKVSVDDRRHAQDIARSLGKGGHLFFGGEINQVLTDTNNDQYFFSDAALAFRPGEEDFLGVPMGVFPHSSRCYSRTCHMDDLPCYSYSCPKRQPTESSLDRHGSNASTLGSKEKVWANSVPASVVAAASKQEKNRQEAIFEVVNTESNYVRDLELLDEIFITPLRKGDIVDPARVEDLIENVFMNYEEIRELNKKLLQDMRQRQIDQPLVESIGDVILPHIEAFEDAYMRYIPRIILAEFAYKQEEAANPKFAQFLVDCTRHPDARRLGLRHFIGQPYQRIPRYPLLLREVIKRTEDGVKDKETVEKVVQRCTELGKKVDACMPDANRQLRLLKIRDRITWKSGDITQDLKLNDKSRKLYFDCVVKRRSNLEVQMLELRIFLFDHMLLMTKEKKDKQGDKDSVYYQVSKRPIPLELLHVISDGAAALPVGSGREPANGKRLTSSTKSSHSGHRISAIYESTSGHENTITGRITDSKNTFPIDIEHRGRRGATYTLFATHQERAELLEHLATAQALRSESVSGSHVFETKKLTEMNVNATVSNGEHVHGRRVTCSVPYFNILDGVRRIVIGTENGVFVGMEDGTSKFQLAMKDLNVTQIAVLEQQNMLLILCGKTLKAYHLSCLEPNADKSLQVGQQLGKSVQFFTAGQCAGRTLVITMRRKNTSESHFSAYEPNENAMTGGNSKSGMSLRFGKSKHSEWFKLYKDFYVGTEATQLLMLAKMVCVVCAKGFEILVLEHLSETEVFPEKKDPDFQFLVQRDTSQPICMFRINIDEFLLCYSEFAFVMTKKGKLVKHRERIEWEGRPESFAMAYPYILAFEDGLIEVRHIETGALEQIILGKGIKRLHAHSDPNMNWVIHAVMNDPKRSDTQIVVKIEKSVPAKTVLGPVDYTPKTPYSPYRDMNDVMHHNNNGAMHLMSGPVHPTVTNQSTFGQFSMHSHPVATAVGVAAPSHDLNYQASIRHHQPTQQVYGVTPFVHGQVAAPPPYQTQQTPVQHPPPPSPGRSPAPHFQQAGYVQSPGLQHQPISQTPHLQHLYQPPIIGQNFVPGVASPVQQPAQQQYQYQQHALHSTPSIHHHQHPAQHQYQFQQQQQQLHYQQSISRPAQPPQPIIGHHPYSTLSQKPYPQSSGYPTPTATEATLPGVVGPHQQQPGGPVRTPSSSRSSEHSATGGYSPGANNNVMVVQNGAWTFEDGYL